MTTNTICVLTSSLSFFGYIISYFVTSKMKDEFKRFKLEKIGLLVIILQFIGAAGLLVGLKIKVLLTISSFGLGLLMLCGFAMRLNLKDNIWISLPSAFFMILNFYIFIQSIK